MLPICLKGDVWDDLFCFTINNSLTRCPIFHGNTGNGNFILTHGELIGVAIAGCESRGGGERFCCFACSIFYFKSEEGGGGAWGIFWIDKGIELAVGLVLIRFHTTDAEAVDCSILRILVVEGSNLYYHSRHQAIHFESKTIVTWIFYIASKAHEVGGSKISLLVVFRRLVDGTIERSRVVGGEIHRLIFPFQELVALWLPFLAVILISHGILAISLDANLIIFIEFRLLFSSTQRIAAGEAIGRCFTYLRSDVHGFRIAMVCSEEVF